MMDDKIRDKREARGAIKLNGGGRDDVRLCGIGERRRERQQLRSMLAESLLNSASKRLKRVSGPNSDPEPGTDE